MNSKYTVLMLDDDDRILAAYSRLFGKTFKVIVTNQCSKAYEIINAQSDIALIVTDMKMPEENGIQFITNVKIAAPEIICILLSGDPESYEELSEKEKASVFSFLSKPCSPYLLAQNIENGIVAFEKNRLV